MIADLFDLVADNLGVADVSDAVLVILLIGAIILFVEDFRKGIIANFIIFMGVFMWFALVGIDVTKVLIVALGFFVLLALSLYLTYAKKEGGGLV